MNRLLPLIALATVLSFGSSSAWAEEPSSDDAPAPDLSGDLPPRPELPEPRGPSSLDGDTLPTPELPQIPDLAIVYEGATGGLSGPLPQLAIGVQIEQLLAAQGDWMQQDGGWGAFLRDGTWLLQPQGDVGHFHRAVAPSIEAAGPGEAIEALVGDDFAVVVWPPEAAETLVPFLAAALGSDALRPPPEVRSLEVIPHRAGEGDPILLAGVGLSEEELVTPLDPYTWEVRVRTVFRGKTEGGAPAWVHVVSRVEGDGARRAELVARWRERPSLYLSAGESVEGRSLLEDRTLSLQRPATWATWKELGLTALAPGEAELLAGIDGLRTEAEAAGIPLVSANLVGQDGEPVFERWIEREVAGRRIVLIGWTDPAALHRLPPQTRGSVEARGPSAVREVLAELPEKLSTEADLVVLFGVGSDVLAGDLPGVDIVLGDFTNRLRLPRWLEVDAASLMARSADHPRAHAPALVSRLGSPMVGRIDLSFDPASGSLRGLRHLRARLTEDLPPSPERVRDVQRVRQNSYAGLEDILVPELDELDFPTLRGRPEPVTAMDAGSFALLAANLLMDRTGADLALLRPLPQPVVVPGETETLYVAASLSVVDEVVLIELTGAQLKRLLAVVEPRLPGVGQDPATLLVEPGARWAWGAGVSKAGSSVTVRGRVVQDNDVLLLATSSFFSSDPGVLSAIGEARSWASFSGDGWVRRGSGSKRGSRWTLHRLVKEGLELIRSEDPAFGRRYARRLAPLLIPQAGFRSGRLTLELDGLGFQVTGSYGVGDREGYSNSRESRVNQGDSVSTSLRGRVALVWDDRIGSVTGYAEGAFGRSKIPELDDPIELEDDLEIGAEAQLRVVSIPAPRGRIPLSAFVQSAFDTEFSAEEDELGQKLPLQRVLRTTAGTTFGKYLLFKELKAGFFVEYDFSAEQGPLAPGVSLAGKAEQRWGPVRLAGLADFKGYFPTEVDTDEDLAFTLQLRTDLSIVPLKRLVPGLSVGAFMDALLFQGKLDVNRQLGLHLLVGAALTYDTDLRPPLRLR